MDLSAAALLLSITIDIDPDIGKIFGLTISWHGLFTAIGIICGVSLSVYLARVDGIPSDVGQELALVSVISAIVARASSSSSSTGTGSRTTSPLSSPTSPRGASRCTAASSGACWEG